MGKRALLPLLLLAATFAVAAGAAGSTLAASTPTEELRADVDCGPVMAEGFPFGVHVTKGDVSCDKAHEVAKRYLPSKHCGFGRYPACVADGFHCREASFELQRKTGIGSFCYTLKRQLPPSKDRSPYRLSLFTRAIAIYAPEE